MFVYNHVKMINNMHKKEYVKKDAQETMHIQMIIQIYVVILVTIIKILNHLNNVYLNVLKDITLFINMKQDMNVFKYVIIINIRMNKIKMYVHNKRIVIIL